MNGAGGAGVISAGSGGMAGGSNSFSNFYMSQSSASGGGGGAGGGGGEAYDTATLRATGTFSNKGEVGQSRGPAPPARQGSEIRNTAKEESLKPDAHHQNMPSLNKKIYQKKEQNTKSMEACKTTNELKVENAHTQFLLWRDRHRTLWPIQWSVCL